MSESHEPGESTSAAEPFVRRWSRRKARARAGDAEPEPQAGSDPVAAPAESGDGSAAEITDADLPTPEELHGRSDLSAYFAAGVSEELRQRALRRVFHSPEFNQCDGLEVYDEDYRAFQGLGEVLTNHMRQRLQRESDRLAGREDEAQEPPADPPGAGEAGADPDPGDEPGGNPPA